MSAQRITHSFWPVPGNTPNPLPNWSNAVSEEGGGSTEMQQITGISQPILLSFSHGSNITSVEMLVWENDTSEQPLTYQALENTTLSVSPGQWVSFNFTATQGGTYQVTVTVRNASAGNAVLDTFTVTFTEPL